MARHHQYHHQYSYSPYPGGRSGSLWRWLLAAALVAVLAGAGVFLVGDDVRRALDRGPAARPAAQPAAQAATTTAPAGGTSPPPAAAAVAATETPEAAAAEADDGEDAPTAAPPPTATATVVPTPTPTPVPPQDVAQTYVERWSAGDFDGLYDLLAEDTRRDISREDFVARYEGIAERAALTSVEATVAGEPNLQGEVPLRVAFASDVVGSFAETNRLPLVREGNAWVVAWTPSLIFADLGADGCVDRDGEAAGRGRILDRDGGVLAEDGRIMRVGVVPGEIEPADRARVLRELSELTGVPTADIETRLEGADPSWFVPLKDFPEDREVELLNALDELPGAGVRPETARVYPLGSKAAHVVGYVSEVTAEQIEADPSLAPGQIVGQAGVEAGADDLLTGEPGARLIVVQCETRAERAVIHERPAVPAKDVVLTIDRELQEATVAALAEQEDLRGSAVVLDPRSGALLAMASQPSFDPNGFVLGFSERDERTIGDETRKPLLNRAAQAAYPTGSIFKAITFAAALQHLGYSGDTPIDCPSTFQLEGAEQVWEDWTVAEGLPAQGPMTLHRGLVNSCNTVFYQLGSDLDRTDEELLPAMAKAFGLGAPTDIPYLPELGGTVPDPKWKLDTFGDYWARGDAVNLAIGQGFLEATPLQMATAYAAIANGGDLLQPFVVARAVSPDGAEEQLGQRVVRQDLPLSRATIAELQGALRDQTSDPTGAGSVRVFGDFPWPIAGKTGTAQNGAPPTAAAKTGSDQLRGTRGQKPHSWFAAFGPYGDEATIASTVMFEQAGEGVSFAAPATRDIYEAYLRSDLPTER